MNSDELLKLFDCRDVILLTESWLSDKFNCDVEGFTYFKLDRSLTHKNARRDSGGIIIYIKNNIKNKVSLLKTTGDNIMWIKFDRSLFDFDEDIVLCLCYNVPTGSSREVFDDQSIFDSITDDMLFFQNRFGDKCQFVISGDLNARVGKLHDYVENEFLHNLDLMPDDYIEDIAISRIFQDTTVNENGKLLVNFCKLTMTV